MNDKNEKKPLLLEFSLKTQDNISASLALLSRARLEQMLTELLLLGPAELVDGVLEDALADAEKGKVAVLSEGRIE